MIGRTESLQALKRSYPLIILSGIILGVFCAIIISPLLSWVSDMGHRIPQDDMYRDYSIALAWTVILGASIYLWPTDYDDKLHLLIAWFVKCAVTLLFITFIENIYPSDSEGYFYIPREGPIFQYRLFIEGLNFDLLGSDAGSVNMFLLTWFYNQMIPDFLVNSYHSLKLTYSMIGLAGIYIFYRAFIAYTGKKNYQLFYFLALFPSILIWESRIGKEALMCFSFSLVVWGIVSWHFKNRLKYLAAVILGFILSIYIRIWMGPILLLPLTIYFSIRKGSIFKKTISLGFGVFIIWITFAMIMKQQNLNSFQDVIKKIDFVTKTGALGGSAINTGSKKDISNVEDVVTKSPQGMYSALFRPLPWDMGGALGFFSGLEGLLLLVLFFRALYRTPLKELKDPLLLGAIAMILAWAFLYGFAIQNYGTAVRWKTQILPIFLGVLLYCGRDRSKDAQPIS